jgi:hypothetical protein
VCFFFFGFFFSILYIVKIVKMFTYYKF